MTMPASWILTVGAVVLVLGAVYGIRNTFTDMASTNKNPKIWWYVDDSSAKINTNDYLKLCQQRAISQWSADFTIVPVDGRDAALALLAKKNTVIPDGIRRTPPQLWMAWLRTTMLAQLGGLWIDGSVLPLSSSSSSSSTLKQRLALAPVMFFGLSPAFDLVESNAQPGKNAGWAANPGHPVWVGMSRDITEIVQKGDSAWTAFESRKSLEWIYQKNTSGLTGVGVDRSAEAIHISGNRLNYEDLFVNTSVDAIQLRDVLWVPLPDGRDKLEMASAFLWFPRLSEAQIAESDFAWAMLARRSSF